jgi:hypothetical protein
LPLDPDPDTSLNPDPDTSLNPDPDTSLNPDPDPQPWAQVELFDEKTRGRKSRDTVPLIGQEPEPHQNDAALLNFFTPN